MVYFVRKIRFSSAEVWEIKKFPLNSVEILTYALLLGHKVCKLLLSVNSTFRDDKLVDFTPHFRFWNFLEPNLTKNLNDF